MPPSQLTIKLGDRQLPRIGLGTNRLTETAANVEFIRRAVASGVGLIDTAHLYTGGSSETAIGNALAGRVEDVVVATKGGFHPGEGIAQVLREQLEESLRRLRRDRIDLYYLHRVDPETPLEDSLTTLAEFRERGLIGHVGLSQVDVAQIEVARRIVPISAVQNEYNLGRRGWDNVVDYCDTEGIVFVPFYPLHGDAPRLSEIAQRYGSTTTQIKLAWLLGRSPQVLPIPGTLSLEHVRENVAALEISMTESDGI